MRWWSLFGGRKQRREWQVVEVGHVGPVAELDAHYSGSPDAVKDLGVLALRLVSPHNADNLVTRLWDEQMRPDWRELAKQREGELGKPRNEAAEKAALEKIKQRMANAEALPQDAVEPKGGADYFITSRRVLAKKGSGE